MGSVGALGNVRALGAVRVGRQVGVGPVGVGPVGAVPGRVGVRGGIRRAVPGRRVLGGEIHRLRAGRMLPVGQPAGVGLLTVTIEVDRVVPGGVADAGEVGVRALAGEIARDVVRRVVRYVV